MKDIVYTNISICDTTTNCQTTKNRILSGFSSYQNRFWNSDHLQFLLFCIQVKWMVDTCLYFFVGNRTIEQNSIQAFIIHIKF